MERIKRFMKRAPKQARERGASLVEYALLVALIAVVCIGAVTQLGGSSSDGVQRGADGVTGTTAPTGCAAVYSDGYSTSPGDPHGNCYSPSHGGYYSI